MGLPQWELNPFIYNILLNFKMLRLKRGWMQLGIIFLKMEKHALGGIKKVL